MFTWVRPIWKLHFKFLLGSESFHLGQLEMNFFTDYYSKLICTAEFRVLSSPLFISAEMFNWLQVSWFQTFSR